MLHTVKPENRAKLGYERKAGNSLKEDNYNTIGL
jgi:hypothetical protein